MARIAKSLGSAGPLDFDQRLRDVAPLETNMAFLIIQQLGARTSLIEVYNFDGVRTRYIARWSRTCLRGS
jgi:hypothetical protein